MKENTRTETRYELTDVQHALVFVDTEDPAQEPLVFAAQLLNLSHTGAKFFVPVALPLRQALRLELHVAEFALHFNVSAEVCWQRPNSEGGYHAGCALDPGIPPALFDRLAAAGSLDRRDTRRCETAHTMRAMREHDGESEEVTIRNLSSGGFCVSARKPAQLGASLHLTFQGSTSLSLDASVQWQIGTDEGVLLGCKFIDSEDFGRLLALRAANEEANSAT